MRGTRSEMDGAINAGVNLDAVTNLDAVNAENLDPLSRVPFWTVERKSFMAPENIGCDTGIADIL